MGWIAPLVVAVAMGLGLCFLVLRQRAMWEELRIARQERADHPDPDRRRKMVRSLVGALVVYASLGVALYVGWRAAGVAAGAISAVCVALAWILGAAAFAVKSAWVSRR